MRIFLDTIDYESIKKWLYLIDGITTNPTLISKGGKNLTDQILKICSLVNPRPVSVEVTEQSPESVYKQAHQLAKLAPNVVVKIPCHANYYPIINTLVQENILLNITLVFTMNQALFMCNLGVTYISPFVGRLDDNDADGIQLLIDIKNMARSYNYQTKILAASLRHVRHLHESIKAGADIATISPELLQKATEHHLTDKGIQLFTADWQKLGTIKFP